MSISADEVQIAIVKETSYGVTPVNPVWDVLPITGESVNADVSSQTSDMMNDARQTFDVIVTNISAAGSISTELAITPAMELLLESAMCNALVDISPAIAGLPPSRETIIGKQPISFTIEKRIPDGHGGYVYHRATGCVVNTMSFQVSPGDPATVSFGIIGKDFAETTTEVSGSVYHVPDNPTVLRGPDTVGMDVDGATVDANCFGEFGFDIDNGFRGIQCLGTMGNRQVAIGKARITVHGTVHFSGSTSIDALLSGTESAIGFEMKNTGADPLSYFAAHFPRVKFTSVTMPAGGTGQDLVETFEAEALFNSAGTLKTLGTNNADYTSMRLVEGVGTVTAAP